MTMGLISAACAAFFAATTAMLPLPCHAAAITTTTSTATTTSITTTTTTYGNDVQEWQLMNGQVRLPSSLQLTIIKNNHQNDGKGATSTATTTFLTLKNPTLIGAGGGGSVFAFDNNNKDQLPATASDSASPKLSDILIKVSWKGSTETVQKECQTLQLLEEYHIEGVERCRGQVPYLYNAQDGDNRVMIVVEPYVPDAVASVIEVPNHDNNNNKRVYVVQQIARTLIQMLAHNIVTIDVQPLISQTTGQVIFIDMTEAQRLQTPFTFLDTAVMGSFITEMLALIPEELAPVAAQTMREELQSLRDNQGIELSTQAKEILMDQSLFFPEQDIWLHKHCRREWCMRTREKAQPASKRKEQPQRQYNDSGV